MARTKGAIGAHNKNMKEALELAFTRSGGVKYLERVAADDPKTFCGLLSKLIPTNINVDVTTLSLGTAMLEASKRLDEFNARTIEHDPKPTIIDVLEVEEVDTDLQPISVEPINNG